MMTNVAKIYQFEFWPEIAPSPGKSHGTSHRRCSIKKYFLEIPQNSQENTCARVSFLIIAWDRCFPVNFVKFLRTPFLTEHLWVTKTKEDTEVKQKKANPSIKQKKITGGIFIFT